MSWHCSRALVEAFSQVDCSDGELSAPLKSTCTAGTFYELGKMTAASARFRSGMTSERSTDSSGEAVLTLFLAAFPARRIPRRLEVATSRMISGRKCGESWQRQLPGTYLPRTLHALPLKQQPKTSGLWVTKPAALPLQRRTWVLTTCGPDIGYVHTPTTKANYAASSMQKWPACRTFTRAFGTPTPENQEWLMGWPIGWTALKPLAMDKFQSWLRRHGAS